MDATVFFRNGHAGDASGVPVLCSDIGGIPETLLSGVTGLLLPHGDIAVWRDAIIELASNTPKRLNMAKQGRDWLEQRFSAPVIGREFEAMLRNEG